MFVGRILVSLEPVLLVEGAQELLIVIHLLHRHPIVTHIREPADDAHQTCDQLEGARAKELAAASDRARTIMPNHEDVQADYE